MAATVGAAAPTARTAAATLRAAAETTQAAAATGGNPRCMAGGCFEVMNRVCGGIQWHLQQLGNFMDGVEKASKLRSKGCAACSYP